MKREKAVELLKKYNKEEFQACINCGSSYEIFC